MLFESSTLIQSLRQSLLRCVEVLPDLLLALVLLVVGWLLAKLVRRVLIRIMRAARVDELAERSGLDDILVRGGVEHTTVTIIAGTVYWLILGAVFIVLLDALGLRTAEVLLERLAIFIPNLLVAIGILVFGSLLARVVGGVVFGYLSNVGSAAAAPIATMARYALLVFTLFMAAEQLDIATEIVVSAFKIAFAALCLAAALAFGIGGREWAAAVIARYTRK